MVVFLIIVALVLVAGLGILIFKLMRRTQDVVPRAADHAEARGDRVVAVDDAGRPVTESEAGEPAEARDDAPFEAVLHEELKDLGRDE